MPSLPTSPQLVIIADDEPVTRRLVSFKLDREGFRVTAVVHGEELLEKVRGERPDAVLLDIMMPVSDGFSTLRRLKQDPSLADIPIMMLTAKGHEEDVVRCLRAGAADYMVKPFSPDELVARIRKLMTPAVRKTAHADARS
ncbi:MAG TPA: response regulator [Opitutaceae bacterium]